MNTRGHAPRRGRRSLAAIAAAGLAIAALAGCQNSTPTTALPSSGSTLGPDQAVKVYVPGAFSPIPCVVFSTGAASCDWG